MGCFFVVGERVGGVVAAATDVAAYKTDPGIEFCVAYAALVEACIFCMTRAVVGAFAGAVLRVSAYWAS